MVLKSKLAICVFSALLLSLAGCVSRPPEKPMVTVSLLPQKYMLEQITGDRIDVRCLLSDGGNPETYDPSFTHLLNVEKSLAYIRMGNIGFEDAIIDKIKESRPDLPIFDASSGVKLINGTHFHAGEAHHGDGVDPHTWSSVKNARVIASNMLRAIVSVDPSNKKYYDDNYTRFVSRLDSIDAEFGRRLASHRGEAFVVWHPSLSYFARDYGLGQVAVGLENKETGIKTLENAIKTAREHDARVFFLQKDMDSRQAQTVNRHIGAREVTINPLGYDWIGEMESLVDALTDSVKTR